MFCMEILHEQTVVVNYMNKPSKPDEGKSSPPTCENCVNTFRTKVMMNMLICVPHLKIMPVKNPVCDLFSTQVHKSRG
jgi:hypothetical protein